jgi:hypothetical protein
MAKDDIWDWSVTAASNTDVGGISIAEGMQRASVNNAMREMMSQVRELANQGSAITAAGTTNIAATGTSFYVHIAGATGITGFGTANAGVWRWVVFDSTPAVTYNATSMILLGNASRTMAAGDTGLYVSEGSGNWRELAYFPDVGYLGTSGAQTITGTAAGTLLTLTSTDADAGIGPTLDTYRNSATPAANDVLGGLIMSGEDSAGNKQQYAAILAAIDDPTSTSEDGHFVFQTTAAGSTVNSMIIGGGGGGAYMGTATGGDKGFGTLNASGLYVNGHGTVAQVVSDTETAYSTIGTIMPVDNTIPQNTEGDEILTVAITPTNASSILRITVSLPVIGSGSAVPAAAALFVDTTANAIAAAAVQQGSAGTITSLHFQHEVSAGSTSARTYKVRLGSSTATDIFLNGDNSARVFGGVATAILKVEEILPQ